MRIPKIKYIFVVVILLRKILFPFSLLYALIVKLRNYLYDSGIKRTYTFKTKTICIGNLSVGGTGKTPMVEYLIENLKSDYKIAVLSRGYKRKSKGFLLADGQSTAENIGDEPFQIHTKFPEVVVAVDADRRNGISILEEKIKPDVVLLDDAFQHRRVKAGLSILLTAHDKLYCNDWYLPTGNLRDSRGEAKRTDVIVVTKCPSTITEVEQRRIREKLKPRAHQHLLFSTLVYENQLPGKNEFKTIADLKSKKVTLVTGIANPRPLVRYLEGQGLSFEHLSYPDHHFFTSNEIAELKEKEVVLTTEKDYGRLKGVLDTLYYIPVRHEFLGNDSDYLASVLQMFMKQYA